MKKFIMEVVVVLALAGTFVAVAYNAHRAKEERRISATAKVASDNWKSLPEKPPSCATCGHLFERSTGKSVPRLSQWDNLTNNYCREHAPKYDMTRSPSAISISPAILSRSSTNAGGVK